MSEYLFKSKRLGFRPWTATDMQAMVKISADKDVMRFFPAPATPEQTLAFLQKMNSMYTDLSYCYFAAIELKSDKCIGFIGLCLQEYSSAFTPATDIGWRLAKEFWGKGYATEGAARCLEYAFNELKMTSIISTAPILNKASIAVMEKLGMKQKVRFNHPKIPLDNPLNSCICYEISDKIYFKHA